MDPQTVLYHVPSINLIVFPFEMDIDFDIIPATHPLRSTHTDTLHK